MKTPSPRWRKWLRAAVRGLGLAAIIAIFVVAVLNSGSGLSRGEKAPPVVGLRLDGKRVALQGFGGRPAVLNFWATWCGPCLSELPELERAHRRFRDRVDFYGLAVDSGGAAEVSDVVARFGLTYPVLLPHREVQLAYKVSGYPTTFIVGPDGVIAHTYSTTVDVELLERDLGPWLEPGRRVSAADVARPPATP